MKQPAVSKCLYIIDLFAQDKDIRICFHKIKILEFVHKIKE